MAILDLFSKRQKRRRGDTPDVYVYDILPTNLRIQIIRIWQRALANRMLYKDVYLEMVDALCDEYGVFELPGRPQREYGNRTKEREFGEFFLNESDVEKALDAIEVCFSVINESVSGQEAIDELNARFKEHGVGYRFENGLITRIDSEFIHAEIVRPALSLL